MADPTPYLSTMTGTSAALVSIVGGLLVARFVGLDSEQQGAQRLVGEAEQRLRTAQRRAAELQSDVVRWDAKDFLENENVLQAIKSGTTELDRLRELADSSLADADLAPYVAEVAAEFQAARDYFDGHPLSPTEEAFDAVGNWHKARRGYPDLPEIYWNEAWGLVFDDAVLAAAEAAAEEARRRKAEAERKRQAEAEEAKRAYGGIFGAASWAQQVAAALPSPQSFIPALPALPAIMPSQPSDWRATRARRYDELIAARERAFQRVEDLESEVARLRLEHKQVVRPDTRLIWGLVVLAFFTLMGVVIPLWVMSNGPHDITAHIRLLFWGFSAALLVLFGYMVNYLVRLMTRKPAPASADDLGD